MGDLSAYIVKGAVANARILIDPEVGNPENTYLLLLAAKRTPVGKLILHACVLKYTNEITWVD